MECHFCGKKNISIKYEDDSFVYSFVELKSISTLYCCLDCGQSYYNLFEEMEAEKKAIKDYLRKKWGIGSGATR